MLLDKHKDEILQGISSGKYERICDVKGTGIRCVGGVKGNGKRGGHVALDSNMWVNNLDWKIDNVSGEVTSLRSHLEFQLLLSENQNM